MTHPGEATTLEVLGEELINGNFYLKVRHNCPDPAHLVAQVERARGLVTKWRQEQEEYPKFDCGPYAAAVLRLCATELEAAIDAAATDTEGGAG